MNKQRLHFLLERYFNSSETPEEKSELIDLIGLNANQEDIKNYLDQAQHKFSGAKALSNEQSERLYDSIKTAIQEQKVIPMRRSRLWWIKLAAAAAILIAFASAYYFIYTERSIKTQPLVKQIASDIKPPTNNRATIRLSNGQEYLLDSASNGSLTRQGQVNIVKLADGSITYEGGTSEVLYNTLTNPRGSKVINITLGDGSEVWLNSGSSITYPVAFNGQERNVDLKGEAYFEVTHNALMPFKVNVAGKEAVEVLGTHFNINSYEDEPCVKTTLLEGSVKVSRDLLSTTIKPGEQAIVTANNNNIAVKKDIDIDEVMAWKNEKFVFQDLDLKSIMRQVGKWYDVDITYTGTIPDKQYVGVISRNVNITEILKMLETASSIKFEINGKNVIVK